MLEEKTLSVRETARRLGYTTQYVYFLLWNGRFLGARKSRVQILLDVPGGFLPSRLRNSVRGSMAEAPERLQVLRKQDPKLKELLDVRPQQPRSTYDQGILSHFREHDYIFTCQDLEAIFDPGPGDVDSPSPTHTKKALL